MKISRATFVWVAFGLAVGLWLWGALVPVQKRTSLEMWCKSGRWHQRGTIDLYLHPQNGRSYTLGLSTALPRLTVTIVAKVVQEWHSPYAPAGREMGEGGEHPCPPISCHL